MTLDGETANNVFLLSLCGWGHLVHDMKWPYMSWHERLADAILYHSHRRHRGNNASSLYISSKGYAHRRKRVGPWEVRRLQTP